MLKIYCSKCGNPNFYTQTKPKFCTNCGTAFFGAVLENKKETKQKMRLQTAEDEYDEEDDSEDQEATPIPSLASGLEVEYEGEGPKKESLGRVAATVPDNMSHFGARGGEGISAKDMLKIFKKEAGTLRKK